MTIVVNEAPVTRIPRWRAPKSSPPEPAGEYYIAIPGKVAAYAGDAGTPVGDTLLTAALAVLAALTAESDLTVGYRPQGGPAPARRLVRLEVPDTSWRELTARVRDAAGARRVAGDDAPHEVVVDLAALEEDCPAEEIALTGEVSLVIEYHREGTGTGTGTGAIGIRLRYRTDVLDAEYAERFGGYLVRALELAAADPDSAYRTWSLLSDAEIAFQLYGLAGPQRPVPGHDVTRIFAEQVRSRPTEIAVGHGAQAWSYQELDDRANQVAHALTSRGLVPEDVVGVVTERNLGWVAAIFGVLRAGGVYLPIRPQFPASRIGVQLTRSAAKFVLTEKQSAGTLDEALGGLAHGCTRLDLEDVFRDEDAVAPNRTPAPDQLAYIYFTSGSTGEPKGAMCEHAGMVNHLYAKVDDLDLAAGVVVTQVASQCFDISLWQVVAPLLVGGRVRIIDTETQLDVGAFLDELREADVDVIQIVPSYFEVLLTELENHPRDLGRLRVISITGEALKYDLVRRWFERYPGIELVNAYGATEVSDDTMHEVLDRLPDRDFVTVGRSLRNVNTYVLDRNLRLVPLGSPGEITFSGVCVGRGYINDEERTRQAFVPDPYRPGTRMYRTGDFGRWLPEGRIEFLGRRDEQIKIRGFRIEIGEIENRILAMPEVREAAVVVEHGDKAKNLVGFYTAPSTLAAGTVRDHLAGCLPDYMVPTYCHRLDSLPLTENGKTDKKALAALAATLGHGGAPYVGPRTPTEKRLATAWAEVLNVGVERIGRGDNFFALGGTSLAAVRLVVLLDRLIALRDLAGGATLSELAEMIDLRAGGAAGQTRQGGAELLQLLSTSTTSTYPSPSPSTEHSVVATLVCFPYAGGNAVNFQMLAKELEPDGIAVYGVELPGHDFGDGENGLVGVPEVAARVAAEVRRRVTGPVMLWGQCAGAVHAVEVARLLGDEPGRVRQVFVGAAMLDDVARLTAEIREVTARDNLEIMAELREDSAYVEFDDLKEERAELVASAYRHDVVSTNSHLVAVREAPGDHRIDVPLDVVVAADDECTEGYQQRYRNWQLVADDVELYVLDEGGHYFVGTRAAAIAARVVCVWRAGATRT